MRKTLEGSLRIGNVSSCYGDGYVALEVEDLKSDIEFLRVKIDYETWGKLIAGNSSHKVNLEVMGLENLGKKRQTVKATIYIDTSLFDTITKGEWDKRQERIADWIDAHHSVDGWINSRYYGSRDSTVGDYKTGKTAINFTRTRWVDADA